MARKSRSKQRGKGVGSKSQSAGKSKGGSRSSAGKSGGNKSGSGAKGGSKGKSGGSKSGGSKGNNTSSSKSTKSSSNKSQSTKKYSRPPTTLAQKRFREREAAGLRGLTGGEKGTKTNLNKNKPGMPDTSTIGKYRAAQKAQVQNAAKIRNDNFKAEQAAKKKAAQEKQARQFDSSRLFSGLSTNDLFSNEAKLGGRLATSLADTFAKPKFMYQGNFAGRMPGYSNYFSPDVASASPYTRKGALKGIPFAGADDAGSLTRFAVPKDAKISRSVLGIRQYKLNPSQMKNLGMGMTDDVAKFAAKG